MEKNNYITDLNSNNDTINSTFINKGDNEIFKSFWMAGYECSDQMNAFGERINLLKETEHDKRIEEDYHNLLPFNIKTIREGLQWSLVEKVPFVYDWDWMDKVVISAEKMGYQIIWDLCHFGYPSDLSPLHPKFPLRFASFAEAFAKRFKLVAPNQTLIVVPINEVSFISWLGGDARGTVPYTTDHGWHVKYALMNAYIQAVKKIKEVDQNSLILTTEPLINVTNSDNHIHLYGEAMQDSMDQFQVTDILTGKMCPELDGRNDYPDIIGLNYYYSNQWQLPHNHTLDWKDSACTKNIPLHKLLRNVYEKYNKPIILSETSHFLEDRDEWIEMIAKECKIAIDEGIPLLGICIYPIIDRPDWDDLTHWHHSGLWDIFQETNGYERVIYTSYAEAILRSQKHINK